MSKVINFSTDHAKAEQFAYKSAKTRRKMNRRLEREMKEYVQRRNTQMVEAMSLIDRGVCGPQEHYGI
jgi:uncharacterized protein YqfA (UPF0365 family)